MMYNVGVLHIMGRPKIYNLNEDYFTTPMTACKAYILGLILSDGSLNYKKGNLKYVCHKKDIEILITIKKELESSHPIKLIGEKYAGISISNVKLIRSLIDKFKLPHNNKSKNNIGIPNIENKYISHFLRGLFDGDGSIWDGGGTPAACYTGGELMMEDIKSYLNKFGINFRTKYRYGNENKNSCQLEIHGSLKVEMLGKFLYKNATIYLKRKKQKFEECYKMAEKFKNKRYKHNGNEENIKFLYLGGMKQSEISKRLNLIFSSVRACVQRLRKKGDII